VTANTYKRIEAELLNARSADEPRGLVEDSMRLEESFPLFDQATYKKIEHTIKSGKSKTQVQKEIRDTICNGTSAKVQPKISVHLILPKARPGEPLDETSEHRRKFIELTRMYLKKWYLDEGSNVALLREKFNSDYSSYKANMVDTDMERRSASTRVSVLVPFMTNQSVKDSERYFSDVRVTPTLPPMYLEPQQWFPSRHYLSINFPREHYSVLAPKVSSFLVGVWGYQVYGTEMDTAVLKDFHLTPETNVPYVTDAESFNFRNTAHYSISKNAWKLKDGTVARPLVMSLIDDLAILKSNFTWSIPLPEIEKLFKATSPIDLQYFGYKDSIFSPALAIQYQDLMWSRVLYNQTELFEMAKYDGSVMFTVQPNFEAFCKWAVPTTSLQSE